MARKWARRRTKGGNSSGAGGSDGGCEPFLFIFTPPAISTTTTTGDGRKKGGEGKNGGREGGSAALMGREGEDGLAEKAQNHFHSCQLLLMRRRSMRERWRRGKADCPLVFAGIYARSPPPPPAVGLAEKGVHLD
jgi:hypothetical protein